MKNLKKKLEETTNWASTSVWKAYPYSVRGLDYKWSWWNRFLYWIGFKRTEGKMKRIYKSLEEIAGKIK